MTEAKATDPFQRVADGINEVVYAAVAMNLPSLLDAERGTHQKDVGELIVAMLAGVVSAAGRLCAAYEPTINGDMIASAFVDQFNAGRADHFAQAQRGVTQ